MTESGAGVGLGHVARCTAIQHALTEAGVSNELLVSTVDDGWLTRSDSAAALVQGADLAIVDSYLAPLRLYEAVASTARLAAYLDDFLRLEYPRGVVVNGAILAERLPYPARPGVTHLLGLDYFPLRHEFWDAPQRRTNAEVDSVLLTFGGADEAGITALALAQTARALPKCRKFVVVGRFNKDIDVIKRAADERTELVFDAPPTRMLELMLASDIAVASSGQTLYELAKVGVPTVAVVESDNQTNNASGWAQAGFTLPAGKASETSLPEAISKGLTLLQGAPERERRSNAGRNAMSRNGARNLVRQLIGEAKPS